MTRFIYKSSHSKMSTEHNCDSYWGLFFSFCFFTCALSPSTLTWVGLQQNLRLPQDLLGPVLGAVGTRQQVLQVRVQLGLLGLTQFLLRELKTERDQDTWSGEQ